MTLKEALELLETLKIKEQHDVFIQEYVPYEPAEALIKRIYQEFEKENNTNKYHKKYNNSKHFKKRENHDTNRSK